MGTRVAQWKTTMLSGSRSMNAESAILPYQRAGMTGGVTVGRHACARPTPNEQAITTTTIRPHLSTVTQVTHTHPVSTIYMIFDQLQT